MTTTTFATLGYFEKLKAAGVEVISVIAAAVAILAALTALPR